MYRISLYVPEEMADGTAVSADQFAIYEEQLLVVAGGFTLTPAIGAWRSPSGEVYREPLRLYSIDVADARVVHNQVLELAERMTVELEQEAFYVTVSDIEVTGVAERVSA